MCMHTHGRQTMETETSRTTNFWACFFCNIFLYQLTIPFICTTFFYSQVYFRRVRTTNETTTLLACFFHNMILLINKLSHPYSFSLVTSNFLYGRFRANKRVCLDMHCFCSFDNWLCNLISKNGYLRYVNSFEGELFYDYCSVQILTVTIKSINNNEYAVNSLEYSTTCDLSIT